MRITPIQSNNINNNQVNFNGRTRDVFMKTLNKSVLNNNTIWESVDTVSNALLDVPRKFRQELGAKKNCLAMFDDYSNEVLIHENNRKIRISSVEFENGDIELSYKEEFNRANHNELRDTKSSWQWERNKKRFYRVEDNQSYKLEVYPKVNKIKAFFLDLVDIFFID